MHSADALLEKFVNLPDLLARVEDDRELLAELFAMFQEELPRHLSAVHQAISDSNPIDTMKAAHALKGMLANLSMNRAASLAATIEAAARTGDMLGAGETQISLDAETVAIVAAVEAFLTGKVA